MTAHRTMPSEIDPSALADLVADALAMPTAMLPRPRQASVDLTREEPAHAVITIPDTTASLLDGIGEYGA
jgi:hypothetical protein